MKSNLSHVILILAMFASCNSRQKDTVENENIRNRFLLAISWYQHSSEMEALYYQGFNFARFRLDEAIKSKSNSKPLAVIVDIDETMLNNSPFEATLLKKTYKLSDWYVWTSKAKAKALPGALEFAKYAKDKQVEIFYITNRDDKEREATLKNLKNDGFPYADVGHLYTKSDLSESTGNTSSKEERRKKVAKDYDIVLLIGDNLNDFSNIFENRRIYNGKDSVEKNNELFGKKFIILPNPMYGAWEKPLYDYKEGIGEDETNRLLKAKLISE